MGLSSSTSACDGKLWQRVRHHIEEEADENVEGTSQVVEPEDNSGVTALSPRMDDGIFGISHYT